MRVKTRLDHHCSLVKLVARIAGSPLLNTDLAEISRSTGFSPDHLNKLFRGFTGETAVQFARRLSLEMAAKSLVDGEEPISSVARGLGYAEPEAFTKAFREAFGQPPSSFVKDDVREWRLPCISGVHWGEDVKFQPLMAGAAEFGLNMVIREPLLAWARPFQGDYRTIPDAWRALRSALPAALVEGAAWLTVFHDDGLKTVNRDRMRWRLGYVASVGLGSPPPGFEDLMLPGGPYISSEQLQGNQAHWDAWVFLNRNWVPKPESRLELPGFDLYEQFPEPWKELRAQIWLGLE